MRRLTLLFAFVLAVNADTEQEQWKQFKLDHSKTYRNLREEQRRFQTFKSNLGTIQEHNSKYLNGESTYYLGINSFSDLTDDEFRRQYLNYRKSDLGETKPFKSSPGFVAPEELDWRTEGIVSKVKNQASCGACWAFSATGALESQYALKTGQMVSLSEQELMDCSVDYGNMGCSGGLMTYSYEYVMDHGISTEESYPYTGLNETCETGVDSGVKISGYVELEQGEDNLRDAVASVGPISVGIFGDYFRHYAGGLYNDVLCLGLQLDHAVLAVGYGHYNISPSVGYDHWILKNSWGSQWGEEGYLRMVRNMDGQCGIGTDSSYPIL